MPPTRSDHGAGFCLWCHGLTRSQEYAGRFHGHPVPESFQPAHGLMDNLRLVAIIVVSGSEFLIRLAGHHHLVDDNEQTMC